MHSPLEDWAFSMAAPCVFLAHHDTRGFLHQSVWNQLRPLSITPFFLTAQTLENRLKNQKNKHPVFVGNSLLLFDKSRLPSSPGGEINWVNSEGRWCWRSYCRSCQPASEIISCLAILGVAIELSNWSPKMPDSGGGVIIDPFFGSANRRRHKWSWRSYFLASEAEWVTTCIILQPTVVESLKITTWKNQNSDIIWHPKKWQGCLVVSQATMILLESKISSKGQRHRPLLGEHREIHMTWHHQHVQTPFRGRPLDG